MPQTGWQDASIGTLTTLSVVYAKSRFKIRVDNSTGIIAEIDGFWHLVVSANSKSLYRKIKTEEMTNYEVLSVMIEKLLEMEAREECQSRLAI